MHGSTDTEVVFYLALTLGLEREPIAALERAVGVIEQMARRHGIAGAVQATFGVSDGESLWAVCYATEGRRGRCSRRPTSTRFGTFIRTIRAFSGSARMTG